MENSHQGVAGTVIGEYGGMSKKGYAPYNMKKENQDVCFMHQDAATCSMLLGTFDGHGEHGHHVSRYFQRHLCKSVVKHPAWASDPAKAEAFARAVFDRFWGRGEPISDAADLEGIAKKLGIDPADLTVAENDEAAKKAVADAVAKAEELGAFGTPTFFVDGEMYWGHDRLDALDKDLAAKD